MPPPPPRHYAIRRRHFAAIGAAAPRFCLFASFHATPSLRHIRRRIRRLLLIFRCRYFSRHAVISQRHLQPDIDTFHAATPPLIAMPLRAAAIIAAAFAIFVAIFA
jgi:hypothetical protein